MKYHPRDASHRGCFGTTGQKDLLVETRETGGNILTGDNAAAARYIEARLSKFALEVLFNPQTTLEIILRRTKPRTRNPARKVFRCCWPRA
ncbi:MAG: hypothetical protein IPH20_17850 [Bacteroidales bacterium]|nr:hypothetical protein [Bacteroidales bacterium]